MPQVTTAPPSNLATATSRAAPTAPACNAGPAATPRSRRARPRASEALLRRAPNTRGPCRRRQPSSRLCCLQGHHSKLPRAPLPLPSLQRRARNLPTAFPVCLRQVPAARHWRRRLSLPGATEAVDLNQRPRLDRFVNLSLRSPFSFNIKPAVQIPLRKTCTEALALFGNKPAVLNHWKIHRDPYKLWIILF